MIDTWPWWHQGRKGKKMSFSSKQIKIYNVRLFYLLMDIHVYSTKRVWTCDIFDSWCQDPMLLWTGHQRTNSFCTKWGSAMNKGTWHNLEETCLAMEQPDTETKNPQKTVHTSIKLRAHENPSIFWSRLRLEAGYGRTRAGKSPSQCQHGAVLLCQLKGKPFPADGQGGHARLLSDMCPRKQGLPKPSLRSDRLLTVVGP